MDEFFIGIALPAKVLLWFYVIISPISIIGLVILKGMK